MLAGDKRKLFAIVCLCVLPINFAYACYCGGPFDSGPEAAAWCPHCLCKKTSFAAAFVWPLLFLIFCALTLVSWVFFRLVWASILRSIFIRRNWRPELDRNLCLVSWLPLGAIFASEGAESLYHLIFSDDHLSGLPFLIFMGVVQAVMGIMYFSLVTFLSRKQIANGTIHHGPSWIPAWIVSVVLAVLLPLPVWELFGWTNTCFLSESRDKRVASDVEMISRFAFEVEMTSRFAFEPDVQPKMPCVQGRVRHGHFVGQWKQRRSYPDTLIGIPHGVGLFVRTLSRQSSWVYVGEWANGYAHGRGKYTEYDQELNTVDKVCNGTFERGTYVGTCKKGGHPAHEISIKHRNSSFDLVIRTADLKHGCSHTFGKKDTPPMKYQSSIANLRLI